MPAKALALDANILVRAVLGNRVREVIETFCDDVSFFVPEAAYAEAEECLPILVGKRGGDPQKALLLLHSLRPLVEMIERDIYGEFELEARERLGRAIRTIGRSRLPLWRFNVQSGQKTPTSSDAA